MLRKISNQIILNLKNIPGKSFQRKIVLFECDDWGGIRMPSNEVRDKLLELKLVSPHSHFDRYDTIECSQDMELLFDVLHKHKDRNGKRAVMTPFVNVANPDFIKIKESHFEKYYFQTYPQILQQYNRSLNILELWKQGIADNIFAPEYHGREHLAADVWLTELQNPESPVRKGFDLGYTTVKTHNIHPEAQGFRAACFFNNQEQKKLVAESIVEGAFLFKSLFGYTPHSFVPPNGIFHPDFEQSVTDAGIKALNVNTIMPIPDGNGGVSYKKTYFSKVNNSGLLLYLRNCAFETASESYKGIDLTMKQIDAVFFWKNPAIISTHRVNFMGGLDLKNRDKGLRELNLLLHNITKKWPEVEFMSTKEYVQLYLK